MVEYLKNLFGEETKAAASSVDRATWMYDWAASRWYLYLDSDIENFVDNAPEEFFSDGPCDYQMFCDNVTPVLDADNCRRCAAPSTECGHE